MTPVTPAEQQNEIREERLRSEAEPANVIFERIESGDMTGAAAHLLFRAHPAQRLGLIELLQRNLPGLSAGADQKRKSAILRFCVDLALDFGSFVPAWRSGTAAETKLADMMAALTQKLGRAEPQLAEQVHQQLGRELRSRLQAEGVRDPEEAERIAQAATGDNLGAYIEAMWQQYQSSNMARAAGMFLSGRTVTALGNDYAAFLDHALRVGVSSQTTNPVLIKLAWDTDRTGWDRRIDAIITGAYSSEALVRAVRSSATERDEIVAHINTLVTTAVVEQNCRLLRDIYLLSDGRQGYLNLQVSPENYDDSDAMVTQAVAVYQDLRRRLGGIPNVVIKVPATPAGKQAAAELTALGIGVTVTLTFSLFQATAVADVIRDSNALVSNIAIMNGRLAFPVRDQLTSVGVAGGEEAARWAGVAVARKAYNRLYRSADAGGMGVDAQRLRLLIASLRIYDDWLPDISEMWGVPAITVFPNVRRTFDAHPREIEPAAIKNPTPEDVVHTMLESELFRQAWWEPRDGSDGRPKRALSLDAADAAAVAAWAPVRQTLDQFIEGYTDMNTMILGRLKKLVE